MLSAEDQERFSRHLLLEKLGGKGQELICDGAIWLSLPDDFSAVAKSCARALAAAGVGILIVPENSLAAISLECKRLAPELEIVSIGHEGAWSLCLARLDPSLLIKVSIEHEGPPGALEISLPKLAPDSVADAAALGAMAALEAIKLLARAGARATSPLQLFPEDAGRAP